MPSFTGGDRTSFNSTQLDEHQTETNDYAVLSYLRTGERYGVQVSAFERYSRLAYTPDPVGDLMFYGLAQRAARSDVAEGLQVDGSLQIAASHTMRYGLLFTAERATARTGSQVFPCAAEDCSSVGSIPVSIGDGSGEDGFTYSAYIQDEWRLAPALTLDDGLRYDVLNAYTDNAQLSPRINLVWKPDRATSVHAGYSRYFTPPSLELISGRSIGTFAGTTGYPGGFILSVFA